MTLTEPKLSIIVPVYNVEQWIARCLNSLYSQGLKETEFEIVAVIDGSTDRSEEITTSIAATHTNLRIVSQPNAGLSAARNTGLREARGQYVWFVDSDDWIEPESISPILSYAEENRLDAVCFGLQLAHENGERTIYHFPDANTHSKIYSGERFTTDVGVPPAAWAAIYRREFLASNSLRFMEGILHEDMEFTPRAYTLASGIAFIPRIVYNYFQRSGSIMKSGHFNKKSTDLLTVADSLYRFAGKYPDGSQIKAELIRKVHFAFGQALSVRPKNGIPFADIKARPYFPIDLSIHSGSTRTKYRLINLSPRLFNLLSRIKRTLVR